MGMVKFITGISLGIAVLWFINDAPIVGIYFTILTIIGLVVLMRVYRNRK